MKVCRDLDMSGPEKIALSCGSVPFPLRLTWQTNQQCPNQARVGVLDAVDTGRIHIGQTPGVTVGWPISFKDFPHISVVLARRYSIIFFLYWAGLILITCS